jgi:hypothetical protein
MRPSAPPNSFRRFPSGSSLPQGKVNSRADGSVFRRRPMIEKQSCEDFLTDLEKSLVRHYPYFFKEEIAENADYELRQSGTRLSRR